MAQPLPPILTVTLAIIVAAMVPLSAFGLWYGWSTLQADRRIMQANLTAEARITGLVRGNEGTGSPSRRTSASEVRFVLLSEPTRERSASVDRAMFQTLARGQTITVWVDPADPDHHVLDRAHEVRGAWIFVLVFGALLILSGALAIWMLRGGLRATRRVT